MAGGRRALLIATDTYSDRTFRKLRSPRVDADTLAALLADPEIGNYGVRQLLNPTTPDASLAIEDLLGDAALDDLVLLYLSGHGVKDDNGQLYLATSSTRSDRLSSTALPAEFIRSLMDRSRSRRIVVWLDCCYSGAFPRGSIPRAGATVDVLAQLGGHGSAVMTSSAALEYAFEPSGGLATLVNVRRPSLFTGALVDGLRTGDADLDGDGLIDVVELYEYVYRRVRAVMSQQTPTLDSKIEGKLLIASAAKHGLPSDVRAALHNSLTSVRAAVIDNLVVLARMENEAVAKAAKESIVGLFRDEDPGVAAKARASIHYLANADPTPPDPGIITTKDRRRPMIVMVAIISLILITAAIWFIYQAAESHTTGASDSLTTSVPHSPISGSDSSVSEQSPTATSAMPATTTVAPPPTTTSASPLQAVDVQVFNNSLIQDLAANAAQEFRNAGFNVVFVGNYSQGIIPYSTAYYSSAPGEQEVATKLAQEFGIRVAPRFPGIEFASPGVIVILREDFHTQR